MYDFLDSRLLPKAECSAAAMDNYEITNLVSDNVMTRARGFLAYTSIKPPVDIIFELLASVSIRYISISCKVGNQQVTGIELYAKNDKSNYVLLGTATNFNEPGVIFCNLRYYSKELRPENTDCDYHLSFLNRHAFRNIINSNRIKVRVFRTNKSVPCLGFVKVVGKVSKCCSKATAETIERLMSNKASESVGKEGLVSNEDIFDIPDEFKDALTFEIMALPMTLPSGHTVDQTTLEKCLQNDVRCGRHALDPFTFTPITNDSKPVLNVPLKSRIDIFLLQNAHRSETHTLKRTVGRKAPATQSSKTSADAGCIYNYKNREEKRIKNDSTSEMNQLVRSLQEHSNYIPFLHEESNSQVEVINKCANCFVIINLYRLPCLDLYCRMCLLKLCFDEICSKCKKPFMKKDVEKYNS